MCVCSCFLDVCEEVIDSISVCNNGSMCVCVFVHSGGGLVGLVEGINSIYLKILKKL